MPRSRTEDSTHIESEACCVRLPVSSDLRSSNFRAAVAGGARTLESLGEVSDAGTVCGGCIEELERLLRERSNGNKRSTNDRTTDLRRGTCREARRSSKH